MEVSEFVGFGHKEPLSPRGLLGVENSAVAPHYAIAAH